MTPDRPERRDLEVFLAVAEHGGLAAAGRALQISTSSVSQSIRRLEHALGVELFIRSARPFRLTAAGRSAEPLARRTLRDMDLLVASVSEAPDAISGHLTICTIATISAQPLAQLVGVFRERHPRVRIDIIAPHTPTIQEVSSAVRSGRAELGMTEFPVEARGLRLLELDSQEFIAVLPPGTGRGGRAISPEEFIATGIVVGPYFETSTAYSSLFARVTPEVGRHIVARTDHRHAFIHLVAEGIGATLVHSEQAAVARRLGCETVPFTPTLTRRTGLVYPADDLAPAARAFVRMCQEQQRARTTRL